MQFPHTWALESGERLPCASRRQGDPFVQLTGIVAIGALVFGVSLLVWRLIDTTLDARISPRVEELGQDDAEFGIEAFPEFILVKDD